MTADVMKDVTFLVVAMMLAFALGVATGGLAERDSHRCPVRIVRPVAPDDFRR